MSIAKRVNPFVSTTTFAIIYVMLNTWNEAPRLRPADKGFQFLTPRGAILVLSCFIHSDSF
jgi:hypothetical protein